MITGENRRRSARQRVLKRGQIIFNGRTAVIDCTVHDISATGARLRTGSPIGIPDTFDLTIADGPARPCRVVWRKPDQMGIEFR
jgi:hypothetical protein